MGREFGRLRDQRRIQVAEDVAGAACPLPNLAKKLPAVRVLVRRVGIRKMRADVASADGTEDGVAHRMQQYVRVRMSVKPQLERNRDSPEHEAAPRDQHMYIETVADADGGHCGGRAPCPARIASASATSSG